MMIGSAYKPGDPPPEGYCQWFDWVRVQIRAGLRQRRCVVCGLYRFPQETCCEIPPEVREARQRAAAASHASKAARKARLRAEVATLKAGKR